MKKKLIQKLNQLFDKNGDLEVARDLRELKYTIDDKFILLMQDKYKNF